MARWMLRVGLLSLVTMTFGCGGASGPKPLPSAEVAGTVQLDGKPLPDGDITLIVTGQSPSILPIKDGKFSGKAVIGENHVEIRAYKVGKPIMMNDTPVGEPVKTNYIAEQYNDRSAITTKVASGGTKDLKFDVAAK